MEHDSKTMLEYILTAEVARIANELRLRDLATALKADGAVPEEKSFIDYLPQAAALVRAQRPAVLKLLLA